MSILFNNMNQKCKSDIPRYLVHKINGALIAKQSIVIGKCPV